MQPFYSHGKLLISAEYAVLDGALALALPTKFGQYLHIESTIENTIIWKSISSKGIVWFEAEFKIDATLKISTTNTSDIALRAFFLNTSMPDGDRLKTSKSIFNPINKATNLKPSPTYILLSLFISSSVCGRMSCTNITVERLS